MQVKFQVVDVGGQRNERRKWIHSFEDVSAIIYMCAISEYDQKLFEDLETNRLTEAFTLFESVLRMQWFKKTTIILFLNKSDLFEQKYHVDHVPLNASGCFPDAPNDKTFNTKVALAWIGNRFKDIAKKVRSHCD
jgi:GTPase SAR1 family protein